MQTNKDEISTMVYELILLKRKELSSEDYEWVAQLYGQEGQITLSAEDEADLRIMHRTHMGKHYGDLYTGTSIVEEKPHRCDGLLKIQAWSDAERLASAHVAAGMYRRAIWCERCRNYHLSLKEK